MTTLKTAAALALAALALSPAAASAQEVVLRVHHFLTADSPLEVGILQPWEKAIEEQSGGRIDIQRYPSMQLGGKPPQLFDQARDGIVDVAWTLLSYTPGRFPLAEVFELPFVSHGREGRGRQEIVVEPAIGAAAVHPDHTIDASVEDPIAKVMELTDGRGADVIITATPANVTQEQALHMAARNGRISFFGGLPKTDPTITCDSNLVHYRQLHIHGANGSAPEHNKRALEYISTGQVPVKDLITRHIPLDDVLDAFQIVKNGEAIKVTVEPAPAEVPAAV